VKGTTQPATQRSRRVLVGAIALLILAPLAVSSVLLLRSDEHGSPRAATASEVRAVLARCRNQLAEGETRACYEAALKRLVEPAPDPRPVLQQIADVAWASPGEFLLPNCHGLMHTVGREYATEHGVTLATLMDYLPGTNDPGCPAGFAHGVISGVAPQLDPSQPKTAARICDGAQTRYQRYSCVHGFGHAFMRLYNESLEPSLALCTELGTASAPDCAQGVYHDYWFSVSGFDSTRAATPDPITNPRRLCARQAHEFVRPCWYRAFLDTRPDGFETQSATDMDGLCSGLVGVQREACITAASVIGPPDPREQLANCAGFRGLDAVSCIHGAKVQNLLQEPLSTHVDVIRHCDVFTGATRLACYRWLGKTLAVLTDGDFRRTGCSQLDPEADRACTAGARSMNDPLVTFS